MFLRSDEPSPILTPAPDAPGTSVAPGGSVVPGGTATIGAGNGPGDGAGTGAGAHSGAATHLGPPPLDWAAYAPLLVLCLLLAVVVLLQLTWMLSGWRSRTAAVETLPPVPFAAPRLSFSVLVAALGSSSGVAETLSALAEQTHPDLEIELIVDGHDPDAVGTVSAAAAQHPSMRINVLKDRSIPLSKPAALNRALESSRGDVIAVFEAGDAPDADLLSRVDARLRDPEIAIVQGGLQPTQLGPAWWRLASAVEQYFWFRSRLLVHERAHAAVLHGSAVFVRAEWLFWSNGWDAHSLAEGGELGLRASAAGARVAAVYGPGAITRTSSPTSLRLWAAERTRSDQGTLQLLASSGAAPQSRLSRPRARLMLGVPFLEALAAVLIPIVIVCTLVAGAPPAVALLTLIPLAPVILSVVVEVVGLADLAGQRGERFRARDGARIALGWFPYRALVLVTGVRSIVRHALRVGTVTGPSRARSSRTADAVRSLDALTAGSRR